jgi:hypothetical protein
MRKTGSHQAVVRLEFFPIFDARRKEEAMKTLVFPAFSRIEDLFQNVYMGDFPGFLKCHALECSFSPKNAGVYGNTFSRVFFPIRRVFHADLPVPQGSFMVLADRTSPFGPSRAPTVKRPFATVQNYTILSVHRQPPCRKTV